jgi:hypothetical protein
MASCSLIVGATFGFSSTDFAVSTALAGAATNTSLEPVFSLSADPKFNRFAGDLGEDLEGEPDSFTFCRAEPRVFHDKL